jgi:hypothetical protein
MKDSEFVDYLSNKENCGAVAHGDCHLAIVTRDSAPKNGNFFSVVN